MQDARARLGIDPEKFVIFLGAYDFTEPRKGAVYALEALAKLSELLMKSGHENNILILTAGLESPISRLNFSFESIHLGVISGDANLVDA